MSGTMWANRRATALTTPDRLLWSGSPGTRPELSRLRAGLREVLQEADGDAVEDLLLIFEELASNGLRHGGAPVRVTVHQRSDGWLLAVTDTAAGSPPAPAVGRDAALGGLGLHMVARMAPAHGWFADGRTKTVWALLEGAVTAVPAGRPA